MPFGILILKYMIDMLYKNCCDQHNELCIRNINSTNQQTKEMGFGILPGAMTPEFGDALIVIDAIALALFAGIVYSAKIAAGSSRLSKLLAASTLFERIRLWRAAHKSH